VKVRRRALAPSLWDLVEAFYLASHAYSEVFEAYESRVLAHARERGVDRKQLRLDAETVSQLLDLGKLESLRNGPLHDVKDIAHALFRRKASTDKLDRYVSEIFHELSILKEEQYKVSTFAPEYQKRNELEEYESILDEVHKEFPRKVHNIHDLFEKARWRLEAILRKAREETVLIRSLSLFGEKLLEKCYPGGVEDLIAAIYPGGALEGHLVALRSFARGGFAAQARIEAKRAEAVLARGKPESMDQGDWDRLAAETRLLGGRVATATPVELVRGFASSGARPAQTPSSIGVIPEEEMPPVSADDMEEVDLQTPAHGTAFPPRKA
jgi:hypothetical protein